MKTIYFISALLLSCVAASAQTQSHSAIQRITIRIQKATVLEFKEAKQILADSSALRPEEKLRRNLQFKQDLIIAEDESTTYLRIEAEEPSEEFEALVVTKSAI